jgi:hypothetical protein
MATAAKDDSRNWILISKILGRLKTDSEIDSEMRRLMGKIADGQLRIRYFNADDQMTWPRTGHRYDPLPDEFFRSGEPKWKFSMVTFNERTIHQIEIFVPTVDSAEPEPVPPAADQTAAAPEPYHGPGRPPQEDKIQVEARRIIRIEGRPATPTDLARKVHQNIGCGFSTAKQYVGPIWDE